MDGRPHYQLILRSSASKVPAIVRLRKVLKELARYGFTCTKAVEVPAPTPGAAAGAAGGPEAARDPPEGPDAADAG